MKNTFRNKRELKQKEKLLKQAKNKMARDTENGFKDIIEFETAKTRRQNLFYK